MRKLNAPGDSVQDVFSTCIESYRDAALKNRLRSIVPVLSDEASRFEDCVLTSKTHTIPTADNVGGVVSKAEMLDIYESKFVKGTGRPSHTEVKKSTESSRFVEIFKVLCHQQRLFDLGHRVRLRTGVFETECNDKAVHLHRNVLCWFRVPGMIPVIHRLLVTHVFVLLYMVCCQVCSSS